MAASHPQALEETLSTQAFLQGSRPSELDNKVFKEFHEAPDHATYPNVYGWYLFINQFTPEIRVTWPDLTPKVAKVEEKKVEAPKAEAPKAEAPKAEEKPAEDDDFGEDDLFGEDPNAEEEARKLLHF